MPAAISFQHVSFQITGRPILDNLTLDIFPGETVVLLGRSGCGKTTALRMVNAMLMPTSGEVLVDEKPTREWDKIALRRRTGYVIQDIGLFPHFTVAGNIALVPRLERWPQPKIAARITQLLDRVGLEPSQFLHRYPRQLSGGQRQRVGVARALAADPPVLLWDEPFGALDPVTRTEAQRQFALLNAEVRKTSLFVTHDVREALRLGTRIALMVAGRIEVLATPGEFQRSEHPEARAFLSCLE